MQDGQDGSPAAARRLLLTTMSAADTAACDVVTIRRAIQAGKLRALRLGRHGDYRISVDALQEWLQSAEREDTRS
jgi:excisionase family DNA binding protein